MREKKQTTSGTRVKKHERAMSAANTQVGTSEACRRKAVVARHLAPFQWPRHLPMTETVSRNLPGKRVGGKAGVEVGGASPQRRDGVAKENVPDVQHGVACLPVCCPAAPDQAVISRLLHCCARAAWPRVEGRREREENDQRALLFPRASRRLPRSNLSCRRGGATG